MLNLAQIRRVLSRRLVACCRVHVALIVVQMTLELLVLLMAFDGVLVLEGVLVEVYGFRATARTLLCARLSR